MKDSNFPFSIIWGKLTQAQEIDTHIGKLEFESGYPTEKKLFNKQTK